MSTIRLLALMVTAGLTSCAHGDDPEAKAAVDATGRAFTHCAFQRAAELARQPEPAETIATAAIASCATESMNFREALRVDARNDTLALVVHGRTKLRIHESLIDLVVTMRAGR